MFSVYKFLFFLYFSFSFFVSFFYFFFLFLFRFLFIFLYFIFLHCFFLLFSCFCFFVHNHFPTSFDRKPSPRLSSSLFLCESTSRWESRRVRNVRFANVAEWLAARDTSLFLRDIFFAEKKMIWDRKRKGICLKKKKKRKGYRRKKMKGVGNYFPREGIARHHRLFFFPNKKLARYFRGSTVTNYQPRSAYPTSFSRRAQNLSV